MPIIAKENSVGAWAFLIAVILAIAVGILTSFISIPELTKYSKAIYFILVILGIMVGSSIRTNNKDSQAFLAAGTIIVIVSKFGMESVISSLIGIGAGDLVSSIFASLLTIFVPATIIVALKTVFGVTRV
jgi:xanthosine utilization system XapX-like protein